MLKYLFVLVWHSIELNEFLRAKSFFLLSRRFYMEGSIMLAEDANIIAGLLLGLNSIDFRYVCFNPHTAS